MDFIINFFTGIDGWIYYTILVVNTILIFAIIGYMGEKNNEQLLKASMSVGNSNIKSGATNLTPTSVSAMNTGAQAPSPVTAPISQNNVVPPVQAVNSQQISLPNNMQGVPTGSTQSVATTIQNPNTNVNVNQNAPVEQAPSVLVINSSDANKDVK